MPGAERLAPIAFQIFSIHLPEYAAIKYHVSIFNSVKICFYVIEITHNVIPAAGNKKWLDPWQIIDDNPLFLLHSYGFWKQ